MTTTGIYKGVLSVFGGFVSYYLGGWDLLLQTMLALTILDFVTGTITAIYNHSFSSAESAKGTIKKVYMYLTVVLAVIIQHFMGDTVPIRETVIIFYIVSEGISILENIGKVIEYPAKLKEIFIQLQEGDKK